jgi:hypothetical protein
MNRLQMFLTDNPVDNLIEEFRLPGRLKDFPIKVKAITAEQYTEFQNLCIENPNSVKKRKFNTKRFNELILINCLVDPNLKDVEWLKSAKCMKPEQLMYKAFLPGEINTMSDKILKLSGFDTNIEEEVEEIKNSSTEETQTPGTVITQ